MQNFLCEETGYLVPRWIFAHFPVLSLGASFSDAAYPAMSIQFRDPPSGFLLTCFFWVKAGKAPSLLSAGSSKPRFSLTVTLWAWL